MLASSESTVPEREAGAGVWARARCAKDSGTPRAREADRVWEFIALLQNFSVVYERIQRSDHALRDPFEIATIIGFEEVALLGVAAGAGVHRDQFEPPG